MWELVFYLPLHDHIISISGKIWTHGTSLTLPHVYAQDRKVNGHVFVC